MNAVEFLVAVLLAPLAADDFSTREAAQRALKCLPLVAALGWDHPDPEVRFACRTVWKPPRYYDFLTDWNTMRAAFTLIHPDPTPSAAEIIYWEGNWIHPEYPNVHYGPAWHLERVARDMGLMRRGYETIKVSPCDSGHWIAVCRVRAKVVRACGNWAWQHFVL